MFKWKITYLDCCGVMSVYEKEEYYTAWTSYGAFRKFIKAHPNLPTGYTDASRFVYMEMRKDSIKFMGV